LRAYLLAQAGEKAEATKLLRQIEQQNSGTPLGAEAAKELQALAAPAIPPPPEARIYELANRQQYREVVRAIDELETKQKLLLPMGLQRLYALQALGEASRAVAAAEKLAAAYPDSTEVAITRADLLIKEHKWEEASRILERIKSENPDTPLAVEAQRRLQAMPPIANLNKWFWGEAYLSGDYLGRFGTVVGSGFIRHGYYIPKARWLQPYAEMRFTVDTRSGVGAERSIIADNFVGLSLGVRAQPFPTEYFFLYAQGGLNKDLLGRRDGGDWADDYQAGLYGFKSWGPGTVLHASAPGEDIPTTGNIPSEPIAPGAQATTRRSSTNLFWRGDWFTDVGADFSYYDRFHSWIGYGQTHQGWRLFQVTPRSAVDAYAVENVAWDVRGNYFDNLFEIGPGMRWLWVPQRGWEIILRTEWLQGFYFGRDDLGTRHGRSGQYDDVRVALSVGLRW
jgi:tetratricopeptide (TPR) repeat protein